ncbi:hypothetical protein DMN91_011547 [Ooceraea biroi]|uniref:C2 domain-containing protein n=1 Tax=Ooceraea biroi TaxID=2015173 RepID=A0A026WLN5_OOCBI|nr:uncharacterized protein LOC105277737 [Ooceraea biroi]XP_011334627.1 uncharacterized protein LOC105277737 [Ooceraea biroi]XP_011334629.1 uncharacterized protein LOC105277737 [Ooceraea biroi]XP_011334630.1 uncharacterized protein LOC105277737 [Ooceraea biroi]EZA56955.1 hypothetical protein X777_03139 [Ooceraea biroi]RLU15791.1 hypothetical protein DMN91_011547 [Ooceraea biroi]
MALAKIRNFIDNSLKTVSTPLDRTVNLEPEIGIRIVHSPNDKGLHVTVLGARHLPQNFGFTRVNSYIVKVKLIPGKEKFETTTKNESWPQWNEEFIFPLRKETKQKFGKSKVIEEEINGSRFIVATLYAILEDKPLIATEKKDADKEKSLLAKGETPKKSGKRKEGQGGSSDNQESNTKNKLLGQFFGKGSDKPAESTVAEKRAYDKRRTVGATTIPLDPKNFPCKPPKSKHASDVSTGDMWKPLRPIASGISGAEERKENKKGQVELSLCLSKGEKDEESGGQLILSLHRLRCSLQTMHEHEGLKGQMYLKLSVVDNGRVTHFWKSDRFAPTVSMKFSPETARVVADNPYKGALNDVSFVVKFVSKNKMGKKSPVGHFVIGSDVGGTYGEQWKQALAKPGQQITKWQAFE